MILYGVRDFAARGRPPLGEIVELFVRPDDAVRFVSECLADEPEWADVLSEEEVEISPTSAN